MRYLREGTSGINKEEKWGEHQQQEPKDDIVHVHSSNNGPSPSSSSSSCSPLTSAATYSRRLLGRGSWFGDSVLDDSPRDATASTRGPCKLLRVEQRDFRSLWQLTMS
ncbi:hypothetical protein OUZ56_007912 [Daphnia magna]|uniref:Cyclic nucleotide-binding domain-containing protein n=1 Tax=Daphnia magna TaxID=35525 RepID=A0ABR0ABK8_9CRUS|nr:hypothetical protein OUZ56_007912 [Daphnia magna]